MKNSSRKKLIILPIIAILGVLLCLINVKTDVFSVVTTSVRNFFLGNEEELIREAAINSGFEDVNLYEAVVDEYNKQFIDNYGPLDNEVRGTLSFIGGFEGDYELKGTSISFNEGKVLYYEADPSVNRTSAGNRFGIRIDAPTSLDSEQYENAKIIRTMYYKDGSYKELHMIFKDVRDSLTHYESWPVITPDLSKIEILINWTGYNYQLFSIEIGENVVLENTDVVSPVEPSVTKKGTLSYIGNYDGERLLDGDSILVSNGEVPYYLPDSSVGRYYPGNRLGFQINAPEDLTYDEYKNAKITRIMYYNDEIQIFNMIFDNVKDAINYYECWPVITTSLTKMEVRVEWTNADKQVFTVYFNEGITLQNNPNMIKYKDGILDEQLSLITSLDVSNMNIESTKGIEKLVNLERLDLSDNKLTSVDLSKNTNLVSLNMNGNNFSKDVVLYAGNTSLDVNNYANPVILPEELNVSLLVSPNDDNNYLASYGIEDEENDIVIYGIKYNVSYYEYTNDNYLFNENKDKIYVVNKEFEVDTDDFVDLVYENDKLNIYDREETPNIIKSFDVVLVNVSSEKYPTLAILPDTLSIGLIDINVDDISSNASVNVVDNKLVITIDGILIKEIELIKTSMTSDKYDLSLNYIYTGLNTLDINDINVVNGYVQLDELNILHLYDDSDTLLRNIDVITISILDKAIVKNVDGYIYAENYDLTNELMQSNFVTSNAILERDNLSLRVRYNGNYLENVSIPLVEVKTAYDLNKDYVYVKGSTLVENKVTVLANEDVLVNVTKEEIENTLLVKLNDNVLLEKKVLRINSAKYDVTDSYIFTGILEFSIQELVKTEELVVNKVGEEIIVSYENEELDRIVIKSISSTIYDLSKDYIYLDSNDFDMANISYDSSIVNTSVVDNILTLKYGETEYVYSLVKIVNPYVIKDDKIYSKFNTKFDVNAILHTNSVVEVDGSVLTIKYCDVVKTYNVVEPTYEIPYKHTNEYVYVVNDLEASKVVVTAGRKEVVDNVLVITSDGGDVVRYPLYAITSSKYNQYLDKDYIYSGVSMLSTDDVSGNREDMIEVKDNLLYVKVNNEVVDTYKLVYIFSTSNKYNFSNQNIYTGLDNFDLNSMLVINGRFALSSDNKKLEIRYGDYVLYTYNIIKSSVQNTNNDYVVKDNYIYTGTKEFNKDYIVLENATSSVVDNQLIISNPQGIIDSYDIVTITKAPDLSKGYIYTEFNEFKTSDVVVTKGNVSVVNNNLVIKYRDDVLVNLPIVTIKSNVNLKDGYVYTKLSNFDVNNVTVINGTREIVNNKLIIKYQNEVLKTIDLPRISFNNVNLKANSIFVDEQVDYTEFMKKIVCTLSTCELTKDGEVVTSGVIENNMILNVKYNNNKVDSYTIIVDYLELPNISTDEEKGFINGFRIGSKVSNLFDNIKTNGKVSIVSTDDNEVDRDDALATGNKVKIELNNRIVSYVVIIKGDISGDGIINSGDLLRARQHLLGINVLSGAYGSAADVNNDGITNSGDLLIMRQHLLGIRTIE